MNTITTLYQLKEGQKAMVIKLLSTGSIRRRLQDIGIIKNTEIECIQKSPGGDPVAYLIRGTIIAIRNEDAKNIIIQLEDRKYRDD